MVAVVEYTAGARALLGQWWSQGGGTVSRLGPVGSMGSGWVRARCTEAPQVFVAGVWVWVSPLWAHRDRGGVHVGSGPGHGESGWWRSWVPSCCHSLQPLPRRTLQTFEGGTLSTLELCPGCGCGGSRGFLCP